jgi:hypothetical protein
MWGLVSLGTVLSTLLDLKMFRETICLKWSIHSTLMVPACLRQGRNVLLLSHHRSRMSRSQMPCQSRLPSTMSWACNSLRPHLTFPRRTTQSSAHPPISSANLPTPTWKFKISSTAAADSKDLHRAPCPAAAQGIGTVPGRAGLSTVSPASVSDRGPDWWDWLLCTNTASVFCPAYSRGRGEPRRRRTDREFILSIFRSRTAGRWRQEVSERS